jgi:hypothetical protein
MGTIKHICLRYFIVPLEESLLLVGKSKEDRKRWFKETFLVNKDFSTKRGQEFAIRITEEEDNFVFGKLSRKHYSSIRDKTPYDIQERKEEDWPYVGFVCEIGASQQMVMEYDSVLMKDIGGFTTILEDMVNPEMFVRGYAVSFEPIVDDASFWSLIDNSDGVYSLTFQLSSPNLFGGGSAANESLKEFQRIFNNNSVKVTLVNESGNLKVPKENIESYLEYADKGGGEWKIVTRKKNKKRGYSSTNRAIKIPVEGEGKGTVQTLREAFAEFLRRV